MDIPSSSWSKPASPSPSRSAPIAFDRSFSSLSISTEPSSTMSRSRDNVNDDNNNNNDDDDDQYGQSGPSRCPMQVPAPLPTPDPRASHPSTPRPVQMPVGPGGGILSPPTPAPSPNGRDRNWSGFSYGSGGRAPEDLDLDEHEHELEHEIRSDPGQNWKGKRRADDERPLSPEEMIQQFKLLDKSQRFAFLSSLVDSLALPEALVLSRNIEPKLRRDFLKELPIELALHVLSFIDDAKSLARASQVSKYWSRLLSDETTWKTMCQRDQYTTSMSASSITRKPKDSPSGYPNRSSNLFRGVGQKSPHLADMWTKSPTWSSASEISYKQQYKAAYQTESNWLRGGQMLANYTTGDDSVVTTLSFDENFIVIGLANAKIDIFSSTTGGFCRSLKGHELGVWTLVLVSPVAGSPSRGGNGEGKPRFQRQMTGGGRSGPSGSTRRASSFNGGSSDSFGSAYQSFFGPGSRGDFGGPSFGGRKGHDPCNAARGWSTLRKPIIVSGGCDREVKVWDANTGACIYSLLGHTSTIRCLKVVEGRPIAVSGSRDCTLCVWDIERGVLLHTLRGHESSVRCLDTSGNKAVSGSYDYSCRVWSVDTGRCLHVLRGHYHQIYAVAFEGDRIVTGSLDSTVRIWSATTGQCHALLQGHTSLVGQIQLSGDRLVTGGSDGRVIVFDLTNQTCMHRLCAHDNSVTCLQFDHRFVVSGGNDGRVKLWDIRTGQFIRELTEPCDAVWRVAFRDDKCAILCQRNGKTVLEIITFRPDEGNGTKLRAPGSASGLAVEGKRKRQSSVRGETEN